MSDKNSIHILKPALRAFPKTWLWIIWHSVVAGSLMQSGNDSAAQFVILFTILTPLLFILLYRHGRSYLLSDSKLNGETITFYNRFGGKTESFRVSDIVEMNIKPIAFGAVNTEFVLRNGTRKIMKNVAPKARLKIIQLHRGAASTR